VRYRAYAKVNLSLEILGKRPDGYHELVSVMQTVSIWDEIDYVDDVELRFASSDPALAGDDNLVMRAACLIREYASTHHGGNLMLRKAIPHAAGLGGGSSDAATTLKALNDEWSLHLSLPQLVEIGLRLGSDIPFFLHGGTSLVTGRGEFVTPFPDPEQVWYALVKPAISVSTGDVFDCLSSQEWTDGRRTHDLASGIRERGKVALGVNGLQQSVFRRYPEARSCFAAMDAAAPGRTFMSGSGPTMGALCTSRAEAAQVVASVVRPGWWSEVACSMPALVL
jgi:4-diphosphocytidyl-2-C-methyl-D-erythritol kinase